jgi:DNA-directed RNA polymerase subunit alpha
MEFLINKGQNYFTNDKLSSNLPEAFLGVDAVFMPVTKVNFFVETSIRNSSSDLESLILEIGTNGSIMPDKALTSSAEILENTFGLLKLSKILSLRPLSFEAPVQEKNPEPLGIILLDELNLSIRAYNSLTAANVQTI